MNVETANGKIWLVEGRVKVGDGLVTVRRKGISAPTVANLLGQEEDAETGAVTLILDRLIHKENETAIGSMDDHWLMSGAFVTTLTRTGKVAGSEVSVR